MMRTAVLTTDTTHHTYFVQMLAQATDLALTVLEQDGLRVPYETHHAFEDEQAEYEQASLLGDSQVGIGDLGATIQADTVNAPAVLPELHAAKPDLIVVFGTGRIDASVVERIPTPLLNLHGGNPEAYRGLDTHLWAIWHGDYDNLITTLHEVDAGLDTGAIISQAQLLPPPRSALHELRAVNTRACVDLVVAAAAMYSKLGDLPGRRQLRQGRYYSAMPAALKEQCVVRYERWTAQL